jgi:hypothetical protein
MAGSAVSETRALAAMRAWRRGVGALEPWFRATPFASAHHYRGRIAGAHRPVRGHARLERLLRGLPSPARDTLWIFDLPGPLALRLAYELRRRFGVASALAWNGWYDPEGALDGRQEIPLLLDLGKRIARVPAHRGACLLLDSARHGEKRAGALDNRYLLGEEDVPSLEHLHEMGVRRVRAWIWRRPAEDLAAYLAYLRTRLRVTVTTEIGRRG